MELGSVQILFKKIPIFQNVITMLFFLFIYSVYKKNYLLYKKINSTIVSLDYHYKFITHATC